MIMLLTITSMQAQDTIAPVEEHKFGVAFRKLFLDNQTANGGSFGNFSEYSSGYELAFKYKLQPNLLLNVPLRFGVLEPVRTFENITDSVNTRTISLDGQLHYNLAPENRIWQPSLYAGIGFVLENAESIDLQIPVGISFNFPFTSRASIDWHSEFRKSFGEGRDNFQHGLGFTYWFGAPAAKPEMKEKQEEKPAMMDSDGDGISDDLDLCPQVPGLPEFFGCPDSDGDGIHDLKDKCPTIFGLAEFEGCPDSDGDGVPDNVDECPNMKGDKNNKGCPDEDRDGDGIPDKNDRCPDEKGSTATGGCPDKDGDGVPDIFDKCPEVPGDKDNEGCPRTKVMDSDGDGIDDANDACPYSAGPAKFDGCPDSDGDGIPDPDDDCPFAPGIKENKGCPEIKKEDRDLLELAMRAVQFDLGKATLRPESFRVLDQIASIMSRYKDYNLSISGHTDNTGNPLANQRLSENRAKSCYEYLISKGVNASRLSYAGYGESVPIADNQSVEGRSLNRRVEFTLVPRRQ